MIPVQFDYVAATSVEDAVQFLVAHPGARVVAGGTDLIPALFHRRVAPSALLDITSLSALSEVERLPSGGIRLGALVTLDALAADREVAQAYPALAEALAVIADPQVRNRATLGGNLAQTGSGGDLAAVLIALDAAVLVTTAGGPQRTAVAALVSAPPDPAAIITAVELPEPAPGSAYEKFRHPASGYAICGVAAFVNVQPDGTIGTCRLAVTGATTTTQHLSLLEAAMAGVTATAVDLPVTALQEQLASMSFVDDRAGSAGYRAHLTEVLARRALRRAAARATAETLR